MTDEAWSNDLLDRKSDALFLIEFLTRKVRERGTRGSGRNFVLNVDAGWGQGKTYFLENMKRTLQAQHYVVAYVNAWSDDHADDPLLAVMAAIETAIRGSIRNKSKEASKQVNADRRTSRGRSLKGINEANGEPLHGRGNLERDS